MDVKNLSWKQIKELAEIAIKNGNDFSLTLSADGDCSIDISKHDYTRITNPIYTTPLTGNPTITLDRATNIDDYIKPSVNL